MDSVPYKRTNHGITIISADLAHYEIFRAEVCDVWQACLYKGRIYNRVS